MTDAIVDGQPADDPEICRKGRVWLGWYAGVLAAVTVAVTIAGDVATHRHSQAADFAYARNNAALQVAETFADALPRGY